MKPHSVLFSVFGFAVAAFSYAAQTIVVTPLTRFEGVLSLETFPGPQDNGGVAVGGTADEAWILTADKGRNVKFQLILVDRPNSLFATLHRLVGKKVAVDGTLRKATTGHHHAPFLIIVDSIKNLPNQLPEPASPSVTSPAGAGDAPSVAAAH